MESFRKAVLSQVHYTEELLVSLPAALARRLRAIPLASWPGGLSVAVEDPLNLSLLEELQAIVRGELQVLQADRRQLEEYVEIYYGTQP